MRLFFVAAAVIIALGMRGSAASAADMHQRPRASEALIVNTGSTNARGYRIYVQPSGRVHYVLANRGKTDLTERMSSGKISKAQAAKLFHDLALAMPLSRLPAGHGVKSASFGTSTYVTFGRQSSPDLSFPANAKARALAADAQSIATALRLPRR